VKAGLGNGWSGCALVNEGLGERCVNVSAVVFGGGARLGRVWGLLGGDARGLFLHDLGVAPAGFPFAASLRGECLGADFVEAALLVEEIVRLSGERNEVFGPLFGRQLLCESHQFAPVALSFVALCNVKAGEFRHFLFRIEMNRHAAGKIAVDFQQPVVVQRGEDFGP
jgi:hypothetical protein